MGKAIIAAKVSDFWEFIDPIYLYIGGACLLLLVVVAILMIASAARKRRRHAQDNAIRCQNYDKWHAWVAEHGKLPNVSCNIILKEGEIAHHCERAALIEPKSVRTTDFGGVSTGGKGIRIGGGRAISESHDEWREISRGTLTITNRRIVYDGDRHNRSVDIADVLSVQANVDSAAISCASREKTMIFSGVNGQIIRDIIQSVTQP